MTPKSTVIAGVKFHRTKTGNLVAQRIVKDQRYVDPPWACTVLTSTVDLARSRSLINGARSFQRPVIVYFSTLLRLRRRNIPAASQDEWHGGRDTNHSNAFCLGSCPKGPTCRYIHDPNKVALCKDFMKDGKCPNGEACDLSHELTPERVPNCLHFAKGQCSRPDCPFTHSKAPPSAPVCEAFGFCGYCDKGADCTNRHVFECPNFSNTGSCNIRGCKLLHRERASVLRNQAKQREEAENKNEDLSSDDESVDSDDVDSDEVAEFLEADSDDSDFENPKDFLPL